MCLSDSCVTCVPILLLCDLKRLSELELLMGWATSVYTHPFNYEMEHTPYINRLNVCTKTASKPHFVTPQLLATYQPIDA